MEPKDPFGHELPQLQSPEALREFLQPPPFTLSFVAQDFTRDIEWALSALENYREQIEALRATNKELNAFLPPVDDPYAKRRLRESMALSAKLGEVVEWLRAGGMNLSPDEKQAYFKTLDHDQRHFLEIIDEIYRDDTAGEGSIINKLRRVAAWNERFNQAWTYHFPKYKSVKEMDRLNDIESPEGVETFVATNRDADEYVLIFELDAADEAGDIRAFLGNLIDHVDLGDDPPYIPNYSTVEKMEEIELTVEQAEIVRLIKQRYDWYKQVYLNAQIGQRKLMEKYGDEFTAMSMELQGMTTGDVMVLADSMEESLRSRDQLLASVDPNYKLLIELSGTDS